MCAAPKTIYFPTDFRFTFRANMRRFITTAILTFSHKSSPIAGTVRGLLYVDVRSLSRKVVRV